MHNVQTIPKISYNSCEVDYISIDMRMPLVKTGIRKNSYQVYDSLEKIRGTFLKRIFCIGRNMRETIVKKIMHRQKYGGNYSKQITH